MTFGTRPRWVVARAVRAWGSRRRPRVSRNPTSGFTFRELLTVMVVIGIGVGIALDRNVGLRARLATRGSADKFMGALSLARSAAIQQGRVARLHIDATAGRFWVEVDTGSTRTSPPDTIGSVVDVSSSGVTISTTRDFLCFDARGLATPIWNCPPGDVTVIFQRLPYADTVRTTALGKVRR